MLRRLLLASVHDTTPVIGIAASISMKLVSWWDFDGDGADALGINPLTGSATYSAGRIGQAATKASRLVCNAARLPNPVTWKPGLSMGGWFYVLNAAGEDFELRERNDVYGDAYRIAIRNGNQAHFVVGYGSSVFTISADVGSVAVGQWAFVVATVDGTGAMRLYVGGEEVASGTAVAGGLKPANVVSFGRYQGNVFSALRNDSSFVCDSVLTPEEVGYLYNSGAGRSIADFIKWPSAAWTWFNDQRAIKTGSQTIIGGVAGDGSIKCFYSADGFSSTHAAFSLSGPTSPSDDHDNPAFLRRADGKLLAFYTRHNGGCWVRESSAVDDASAWEAAWEITAQLGGGMYSYNNPVQLTGEAGAPIYNFFRHGIAPNWTLHYSKSLNGGSTWMAAVRLLWDGRPYARVVKNGSSRIDFVVTDGHPGEVATNSLYHFYYQSGGFYNSQGAALGAPPFAPSALTKIYDGSGVGGNAWVWDIQIGPGGNPVVAYSRFPDGSGHRYSYAAWDGSTWVTSEVCEAGGALYSGEPHYSGGVCLDPGNANVVYASRESSGINSIWKYTLSGGGWSGVDMGISGFRPFVISGSGKLAFMTGAYTSFTSYLTRLALADK